MIDTPFRRPVILTAVAIIGVLPFVLDFVAVDGNLFGLSRLVQILFGAGIFVAMLIGLLVFLNLPGRLEVGADGVLIDWRGERRYIGFGEIANVGVYMERSAGKTFIGTDLDLVSGDTVKVPIGENQFGADKQAEALRADVDAALRAYRARELHENAGALERGDRTAEAWLTRLRSIAAGANAGPREVVVTEDRLWRIVEDPAAGVSVRAGAAAALAASSDERAKERLRIAASDTAEPRLRVALESAAAGDDEAMLAALAEIEPETSTKRDRA